MEAYINLPFFGFLLAAVVASVAVSIVVELVTGGRGGRVTYAFSLLAAFAFAFLALHGDDIGAWTIGLQPRPDRIECVRSPTRN